MTRNYDEITDLMRRINKMSQKKRVDNMKLCEIWWKRKKDKNTYRDW